MTMLCFSLHTDATLDSTLVQCINPHLLLLPLMSSGIALFHNNVANTDAFATFVQFIGRTLILPDPIFNYFDIGV